MTEIYIPISEKKGDPSFLIDLFLKTGWIDFGNTVLIDDSGKKLSFRVLNILDLRKKKNLLQYVKDLEEALFDKHKKYKLEKSQRQYLKQTFKETTDFLSEKYKDTHDEPIKKVLLDILDFIKSRTISPVKIREMTKEEEEDLILKPFKLKIEFLEKKIQEKI